MGGRPLVTVCVKWRHAQPGSINLGLWSDSAGRFIGPIQLRLISCVRSLFQIQFVRWNQPYNRLTTCDVKGLLYVWRKINPDRWIIHLINDRVSGVCHDDVTSVCVTSEWWSVLAGGRFPMVARRRARHDSVRRQPLVGWIFRWRSLLVEFSCVVTRLPRHLLRLVTQRSTGKIANQSAKTATSPEVSFSDRDWNVGRSSASLHSPRQLHLRNTTRLCRAGGDATHVELRQVRLGVQACDRYATWRHLVASSPPVCYKQRFNPWQFHE